MSRRTKTKHVPDGPMSPRRREVLDTAARLFHERGYQGTSMDEIADAVGLTKGSLYHHVDSKTRILLTIYEEAADLVVEHTTKDVGDATPQEILKMLIHDIFELITEHRYHVTVYYQEMRWVREWLPEEDADRIQGKVRSYVDYVQQVIQRGIDDGTFEEVDSRVAAYALIGTASWAYQWYRPGGRLDIDQATEVFSGIYLNGLVKVPYRSVG